MKILENCKTPGVTSFARCGDGSHHLFQINPDVPALVALEYAAMLQGCANRAVLEAAEGDGAAASLWPALYLGEMAKAVVDDLIVGLLRGDAGVVDPLG